MANNIINNYVNVSAHSLSEWSHEKGSPWFKTIYGEDGGKRTTAKIARYYNMLLALLVLDAMQVMGFWYLNNFSGWSAPLFPFIVFAGAIFVGAIEVKSIMEPVNDKERREMKQVAALAAEIAKNKAEPEELAKAIAEYLNSEKEVKNG